MEKIQDKYLPIGTVARLRGGDKRVMIIGFCCIADDKKEKVWDYMGCVYPEGVMTSKNTLMFDHDQIEEISQVGLSDDEEKEFKEKMKVMLSEIEKNNSENK